MDTILEYEGLVYSVIRKYTKYFEQDDLYQVGMMGLISAYKNFDDLDAEEKYDGIWACASLLHVEKGHLGEILKLAIKALKSNGVMYLSFKYGDFEGKRKGRYFTDMTEERFAEVLQDIEVWEILEQWVTEDVRADREDKWLNVLLRKIE